MIDLKQALIRIVDDDVAILDSLSLVLSYEGYRVKTWTDAKNYLRDDIPSIPGCLILDIKMPSMTGIELQNELNSRGTHLPIIFLTGHADVNIAVQAMKVGAFDFIQKPFKPEHFLPVIKSAIENDFISKGLVYPKPLALELWNGLTEREQELVQMVLSGFASSQIAMRLNISRRTVEAHRANIYKKLRIKSTVQLQAIIDSLDAD